MIWASDGDISIFPDPDRVLSFRDWGIQYSNMFKRITFHTCGHLCLYRDVNCCICKGRAGCALCERRGKDGS